MPSDVRDYVRTQSGKSVYQKSFASLEQALPDTDVLYVTRIQRERFEDPAKYEAACKDYLVDCHSMRWAKPKMAVLHPLPRVFEIATEFDRDSRAAYFRQAENGLYIRMALLAMVLGKC